MAAYRALYLNRNANFIGRHIRYLFYEKIECDGGL